MCFGGGSPTKIQPNTMYGGLMYGQPGSRENPFPATGIGPLPPGYLSSNTTPGASSLLTPTTGTSNIETTRGGQGGFGGGNPLFTALFGPQSMNQGWGGPGAGSGVDLLRNFGLNFVNLLTGGRYNQQNTNQAKETHWER